MAAPKSVCYFMAIRRHIICHPLVRLAISRFVDSVKKGNTRRVVGVLQNVNWIKARSDTDKCLKITWWSSQSLCTVWWSWSWHIIQYHPKLNWQSQLEVTSKAIIEKICTAKVVCTGFTSQYYYPLKQQTECKLFDEFVPREISRGTCSLYFLTWNFGLKTQDSTLESLRIMSQVSRIGDPSACELTFNGTEFTYPNVRDTACSWNLYFPFNFN